VEKMMEEFNKQDVLIYNTFQMYRVDRLDYLETLIDRAKSKSYKIGLKLVRGAYYEKEKELAQNLGKVQPVYELKEETDQAYDSAVEICLKNHELVHTCIATHNKESVEKAIVLIQQLGMTDHYNKVYFSQLYGMSDNLTFNLAEANFNSSKYVPYGELEKAIPYLLRRAEENSSIEGQVGREYKLLLEEKSRRGM
jgi:proline dehydrogenase